MRRPRRLRRRRLASTPRPGARAENHLAPRAYVREARVRRTAIVRCDNVVAESSTTVRPGEEGSELTGPRKGRLRVCSCASASDRRGGLILMVFAVASEPHVRGLRPKSKAEFEPVVTVDNEERDGSRRGRSTIEIRRHSATWLLTISPNCRGGFRFRSVGDASDPVDGDVRSCGERRVSKLHSRTPEHGFRESNSFSRKAWGARRRQAFCYHATGCTMTTSRAQTISDIARLAGVSSRPSPAR